MWCSSLLLLAFCYQAAGLGCIEKVCDGNAKNELRPCPDSDGACGSYRGPRLDQRIVNGVDIKCRSGSTVYAPFDGKMYYWRPLGGQRNKSCADVGVRIEGRGQWQGYYALMAFVRPDMYGGNVKAGAAIGKAVDLTCLSRPVDPFTNYVRVMLHRSGRVIDPTNHLQNCMCTGQMCESNERNELIGPAFKGDSLYNGVKGWELACRLISETEGPGGNRIDPKEATLRAPQILSPIDGQVIGRIRLVANEDQKAYSGCDNEGIFVVGSGKWDGFTARIYNARYRGDLGVGRQRIVQGQPIGLRLDCGDSPDSIFVEMRRNGRLANVTDMILASNCTLPADL